VTAILVCVGINFALQLSNKWLVHTAGFHQPVSLTCAHFLVICAMGTVGTWTGFNPHEPIRDRQQAVNIFILALSVAVSLVTGIWSFMYISVAMDVTIGCTTPAWTALLVGAVLGAHEPRSIWVSLVVTIAGSMLATGADPQFHVLGLSLAATSTLTRAVKSVMQQKLMSSDTDKFTPVNLTRYMAAFGLVILLPLAAALEGNAFLRTLQGNMWKAASSDAEEAMLGSAVPKVLFVNIFLAFGFTVSQYWMTKVTSAVTSQVVGTSKNAVLSTLSFVIFGDPLTLVAFLGYVVVYMGAGLYTYLRIHGVKATQPNYNPLPVTSKP